MLKPNNRYSNKTLTFDNSNSQLVKKGQLMAFPKDFEPKAGGASLYTLSNLESGETLKLRIMSDFIVGNSVWGEDDEGNRRPNKFRIGVTIPTSVIGISKFNDLPESIKQFVAAVVWNYETERLEILETDKATIIEQLFTLEKTEEYGDIRGYDIKLSKEGQKMDTKYTVVPLPPKDPEKLVLEAYNALDVNLEALFDGADPFAGATAEDIADDVAAALK